MIKLEKLTDLFFSFLKMEKILDCIKILNNPDFVNYRTCQVVYLTIYDSQGYKDWRKMYISLTCTNSHTHTQLALTKI